MADNTLQLNFRDNEEMASFIDSMSPRVGGSISLTVTVGVQEYDENRLVGVVTNVDRDPYGDYEEELDAPAQEFAGATEPTLEDFDSSGLTDELAMAEDLPEEEAAAPAEY